MSVRSTWWQAGALAQAAARAAGAAAMPWFRRADLVVEGKADASPVTIADRSAEAAARAVIAAACPDDAWLGEETGTATRLDGQDGPGSGRTWIVDPIDGTRNFVRGIPLWSVLVACVEGTDVAERVIASAIGFPALGEWYEAVRGGGARCNGLPIAVSSVSELAQAGFGYYTYEMFRQHGLETVFQAFSSGTAEQRGGGDAYLHMLVASGRLDVCVEPGLQVWDIAASSLIVEEAGGRFSDLTGGRDLRAGHAVLSNGALHTASIALLHRLRH